MNIKFDTYLMQISEGGAIPWQLIKCIKVTLNNICENWKKWYFYVTDFSSCVRPVGLIDDRNGKICLIQSQYHLYIAFMDCRVRTTIGVLMVMMSWNHTDSVYMVALTGNNICCFFSSKDSLVQLCLVFSYLHFGNTFILFQLATLNTVWINYHDWPSIMHIQIL